MDWKACKIGKVRKIFRQTGIEQNRCAMACQGCGAVLFLLKSSGITFHNPLLLSHHNQQSNRIDITTAYEKINT